MFCDFRPINTVDLFYFCAVPQLPRPHPAAPPDIVSRFNEFSKHDSEPVTSHSSLKSTGHTSSASTSFNEFWEAPARFWAPSRAIDDAEIEAVLVSAPYTFLLFLP